MLDVKEILDAARAGANIETRVDIVKHPSDDTVAVPVVLGTTPNGGSAVTLAADILKELDARRPGPVRRVGTTALTEVSSFIAYLKRWGTEQAVVYADTAALRLTAVLDDHPEGAGETAWRQHRAVYSCPRAAEWIAWTAQADRPMSQSEFGDWIEARLDDLRKGRTIGEDGKTEIEIAGSPAPTDMLTVARKLIIKTEGEFRRDINPTTGDSILVNKHETKGGSTQIPRCFYICIPCFEGGEAYQIEARLRFSLTGSGPEFTFTLHRAKEIERDAFGEVRAKVATEMGMLVLAGVP